MRHGRIRGHGACLFLLSGWLWAGPFPKPIGWVSDYAGVIPPDEAAKISALAEEISQKTGAQIAVVTIQSLEGAEIADYANRLFSSWGIGRKGKDDGVLILLAVDDRKVWIEVGYGLEPILPDGKVGEILDHYLVPLLRKDDWGGGLYRGVAAVGQVIAREEGVEITGIPERFQEKQEPLWRGYLGLFILLFFLLTFLTGGRIIPWIFWGMMLGGGGRGGGFGGGWGGGGFGGGFGGFGGGSSGGGGAGRSF